MKGDAPMFQKRHYKAIAKVLKAHCNACEGENDLFIADCMVNRMTALFAEDNSRFKIDQFLKAVWG
jgi:hypothetical protein